MANCFPYSVIIWFDASCAVYDKVNSMYKAWIMSRNPSDITKNAIGVITSSDGKMWSTQAMKNTFVDTTITFNQPTVVIEESGTYRGWFVGSTDGGVTPLS